MGTTVIYNNRYLITAFSKFDKSNRAVLTIDEYISFLMNFWKKVDEIYALRSVAIPIFGSGITRIEENNPIPDEDLLRIILWTFKLSSMRFNHKDSKLSIIIHENNIKNIDLQSDGWDMKKLEEILQSKKIHLVYVMTNFQNPTGVSWSLEKKKQLLEFSKKYDFYIIEDDCFADFYYERKMAKPIKAFDKEGRVLYLKTFSKLVMPGIGLAMLIPPKNFVEKFTINKYFIDTTTSGIHQKFLELFIKRGLLEKHLEQLREILGQRMKYMVEKLQKIPHLRILHIPKGGFFLWIELANYIDGEKFYYKCRLRGLSILPGFIFYSNTKNSCKIRISIVSSSFDEMQIGCQIIQDILEHCEGVSEMKLP